MHSLTEKVSFFHFLFLSERQRGKLSAGALKGTAATRRVSSRGHEEWMGERRPALRQPGGPVGEELAAEGLPQVPAGTWKRECSPFCTKPGSSRSWTAWPSSAPLSLPDPRLPLASGLSPARSPHPTFPLPSPLPPPPFFTARVECHLFIYLPTRHQHPFRAPRLFPGSGRRKGQEVLTRRGWDRASGWASLTQNKRWGDLPENGDPSLGPTGTNSARVSSPCIVWVRGCTPRPAARGGGRREWVLQSAVLPWVLHTAPSTPDARAPMQRNPATPPNSDADKRNFN